MNCTARLLLAQCFSECSFLRNAPHAFCSSWRYNFGVTPFFVLRIILALGYRLHEFFPPDPRLTPVQTLSVTPTHHLSFFRATQRVAIRMSLPFQENSAVDGVPAKAS